MAKQREVVVSLEPGLEEYVREQARQGDFGSPSDFIASVLRERFDDQKAYKELEKQLQRGLDDLDAGRVRSIDDAFDAVYVELALKHRAG
ncbi:type II toxin-antitoxin system ParD family antitoxin [Ciceribacter sp. L1K23]|uniref:ribbon-helix-helix domain-containing protein n=1 Tax=unclassified Ciceribacter TaxID=2628820 RepID=UPI001ABDCA89|nr:MULTISPECIES: type II toxin-antitoxin system ParD family antitoxin [unclassified Ciceribacter]MBO3762351.1 type II toxin-antitoxin system ParD family antitoxin [Ciceribacter sp. L1K22]MBR0554291.1 type II toxin-antitoxin system ParD family antitoxin [Ciceribacter sp. L1K23]